MACAVHCLLKPLLFLLPSVVGLDILMSHSAERILLGTGVLLALGSTLRGFRRHRRSGIFLSLGLALVAFLLGRYVFTGYGRTLLTVTGGLTIALTHLLNLRFCEDCGIGSYCCEERDVRPSR